MRDRTLQADREPSPPLSPADAGLPTAPTPDSGLEPTESVTQRVDAGPLSALRYQEFSALTLTHAATVSAGDAGPRLIATLANESGESWAYRVPKGPAPFAGGRATVDDTEVRLTPETEPSPLTDGVLRPGETLRSTLSVSALTGADPDWPEGEYRFRQPITVWTDEAAFSYNWGVTLIR